MVLFAILHTRWKRIRIGAERGNSGILDRQKALWSYSKALRALLPFETSVNMSLEKRIWSDEAPREGEILRRNQVFSKDLVSAKSIQIL
jgi:hypothetical protein